MLDEDDDNDDNFNEELREERLLLNELDLDEGAGFEDEELPLGVKSQLAQSERRRQDIENAINELSESEPSPIGGLELDNDDDISDDDPNWELNQIRTGSGKSQSQSLYSSLYIPEMPQLVDIDSSYNFIEVRLSQLTAERTDITSQLENLEEELSNLSERESDIQRNVDKAGNDLDALIKGVSYSKGIVGDEGIEES